MGEGGHRGRERGTDMGFTVWVGLRVKGGAEEETEGETGACSANSGCSREGGRAVCQKRGGGRNIQDSPRLTLPRPPSITTCFRGPDLGCTGVPRSEETLLSYDPTAGLCLWSYGGPRGRALFLLSEVPL